MTLVEALKQIAAFSDEEDQIDEIMQFRWDAVAVAREALHWRTRALSKRVDSDIFSVRATKELHSLGIEYIHQLVKKTDLELRSQHKALEHLHHSAYLGRKTRREIDEVLSDLGLSLGAGSD